MSGVVLAAVVLCLPGSFWAGMWYQRRRQGEMDALATGDPSVPPALISDARFLVVARTNAGARARQMFENGSAGPNESLEFWDGNVCRGRKGPTVTEEA